jgi:hypothetical protein
MNVCVFCSSAGDLHAAHVEAAARLGAWIGAHGHTLLWGGCNVGLMDAVGRATRAAGGRTVAVLPRFLAERGLAFQPTDEQIQTPDMHGRKAALRERADVFVALPGGVGTWEEFLEVLALKKLGQHDRPILLANLQGAYDPLLAQIDQSRAQGFSPADLPRLFEVVTSSEALLAALAGAPRTSRPGSGQNT